MHRRHTTMPDGRDLYYYSFDEPLEEPASAPAHNADESKRARRDDESNRESRDV